MSYIRAPGDSFEWLCFLFPHLLSRLCWLGPHSLLGQYTGRKFNALDMSQVFHIAQIVNAISILRSFQSLKLLLSTVSENVNMLGFWFCGTSYPTLAVNIPTEGPGVCSMPALSAPLSRRRDVAFPALKCCEFEICQTHQLSSQISDIPPHVRAGQRFGIFWGNHENGENKGICHVVSLPSPQLPISYSSQGAISLKPTGPIAVLHI